MIPRSFMLAIGVSLLVGVGLFSLYVTSAETSCQKIERSSEPVKWAANGVKFLAEPWVAPATTQSIRTEGVLLRLRLARFLQAYNGYVMCPWDTVQ